MPYHTSILFVLINYTQYIRHSQEIEYDKIYGLMSIPVLSRERSFTFSFAVPL